MAQETKAHLLAVRIATADCISESEISTGGEISVVLTLCSPSPGMNRVKFELGLKTGLGPLQLTMEEGFPQTGTKKKVLWEGEW